MGAGTCFRNGHLGPVRRENARVRASTGEQLADLSQGQLPTLLPITAHHRKRLAMLHQPVPRSLEKTQPLLQLRLAALAVVNPAHLFR